MGKTNTEKPTGKTEQKKVMAVNTPRENIPTYDPSVSEVKKEIHKEHNHEEHTHRHEETTHTHEDKTQTKHKEEKKKNPTKKVKKDEVVVNGKNVSVSVKYARDICKFVKGKDIQKAIKDLEEVIKLKKAVPMKGEYAHRKGKIMSGRFPVYGAKEFIVLLKSLASNAINHDLVDPVIVTAYANKGTTIYAKRGRTKKKRSNLTLIAKTRKTKTIGKKGDKQ